MRPTIRIVQRACEAAKARQAIAVFFDEHEPEEGWPEGGLHPRQVLLAIAETIGNECSICRSRHGSEVQHACE